MLKLVYLGFNQTQPAHKWIVSWIEKKQQATSGDRAADHCHFHSSELAVGERMCNRPVIDTFGK